jgi:hypothetical protein
LEETNKGNRIHVENGGDLGILGDRVIWITNSVEYSITRLINGIRTGTLDEVVDGIDRIGKECVGVDKSKPSPVSTTKGQNETCSQNIAHQRVRQSFGGSYGSDGSAVSLGQTDRSFLALVLPGGHERWRDLRWECGSSS